MSPDADGLDARVRHDDKLGARATVGLTLPRLRDGVERNALQVEAHFPGDRVPHKAHVVLGEHVWRDGVNREAKQGQAFEANRLRGKSGRGTCRLAEVYDSRLRRGCKDGGRPGLAPECIEDVARTVTTESLFERRH